jgi:hypothetical protein
MDCTGAPFLKVIMEIDLTPRTIALVVWGRCRPSPDRVPEGASSDRHRCRLVAGDLHGQRQPVRDRVHRRFEVVNVGELGTPRQRPLVMGGFGDRTSPPRSGL